MGGCGKDTYPDLCIHPGWKSAVGARLVRGALNVAYGHGSVNFMGPTCVRAKQSTDGRIEVSFNNIGTKGLEMRSSKGFEISIDGSSWSEVPATLLNRSTVVLGSASVSLPAGGRYVRYLWRSSPCNHPHRVVGNCSVYGSEGLPAMPFVHAIVERQVDDGF